MVEGYWMEKWMDGWMYEWMDGPRKKNQSGFGFIDSFMIVAVDVKSCCN